MPHMKHRMSFHSRDFNCFIFARLLVGRKNKELKIWTFFLLFFSREKAHHMQLVAFHFMAYSERGLYNILRVFSIFERKRKLFQSQHAVSPYLPPTKSWEFFSKRIFMSNCKTCPAKLNNTCCIPAWREPLMLTHPIVVRTLQYDGLNKTRMFAICNNNTCVEESSDKSNEKT